jgi:hypothetical protein
MTVGGRVAYTNDLHYALEVVVWEVDAPNADYVAVQVERCVEAERIEPGDSVWWQGDWVMWRSLKLDVNSLEEEFGEEVRIRRLSNSYRKKG